MSLKVDSSILQNLMIRLRMQKLKIIFTIFFSIILFTLYCQKETNIWYFGSGAGVDFNGVPNALANGVLYTSEGSASISDAAGNLLFYTYGDTVWNKNHQILANGTGLLGNISTTQSAIIIQKPSSNNIYFLFTLMPIGGPLGYSIIDMNLNGGLGEVTSKNIMLDASATEKMTAVKHCNNKDIWLITAEVLNPDSTIQGNINARLITSAGISAPIITPVPIISIIGQMKSSPNGQYLAWDGVNYGTFDNSTGMISNIANFSYLYSPPKYIGDASYGLEFSPNSKIIYNDGYQFEIATNKSYLIDTNTNNNFAAQLQMASNGKLYGAHGNYLSVINNPDVFGSGCNFDNQGIFLNGRNSYTGLPNFMSSYFYHPKGEFYYDGECANSNIVFHLNNSVGIDSVHWIFHDNNTKSNLLSPSHQYTHSGNFQVDAIVFVGGIADTNSQCVTINGDLPIFLSKSATICSGDSVTLSINYPIIGKYQWSTGDTTSAITVKVSENVWAKVTNFCATFSDTVSVITKNCNQTVSVFVPNVMTPNNDSQNDVFSIIFSNPQEVHNVECVIYDRWGVKIYTLKGSGSVWDGKTFDGADTYAGVYYWVLNYSDSKGVQSKTGFVQLIR